MKSAKNLYSIRTLNIEHKECWNNNYFKRGQELPNNVVGRVWFFLPPPVPREYGKAPRSRDLCKSRDQEQPLILTSLKRSITFLQNKKVSKK